MLCQHFELVLLLSISGTLLPPTTMVLLRVNLSFLAIEHKASAERVSCQLYGAVDCCQGHSRPETRKIAAARWAEYVQFQLSLSEY
jgi:hypothetical protein